MQHALNDLATAATKGTKQTMEELIHFLNYWATNLDASIIFHHNHMILTLDSDATISMHQKHKVELVVTIIWLIAMENCSMVQYMF